MAELPPPRLRREGDRVVVDLLTRGEVALCVVLAVCFAGLFIVPFVLSSKPPAKLEPVLAWFVPLALIPGLYALNIWRRRRTHLVIGPQTISLIQRERILWSIEWTQLSRVYIPIVTFSSTTFCFQSSNGQTLGVVKLESGDIELGRIIRLFPEHVEIVRETHRRHLKSFRRHLGWAIAGNGVGVGLFALYILTLTTLSGSIGVLVILTGFFMMTIGILNLLTVVNYRYRASFPEQVVLERPAIDPAEEIETLYGFLHDPRPTGRYTFAYPVSLHDHSLGRSTRVMVVVLSLLFALVASIVGVAVNYARDPRSSLPWIIVAILFSAMQIWATWYLIAWLRRMTRLLSRIRDRLVFEDGRWFVESGRNRVSASPGGVRDHASQRDMYTGLLAASVLVATPDEMLLYDPASMRLEV